MSNWEKFCSVLLPYKMVRFSGSKRRQLFFSVFTEKFFLKPIHVEVLEFLSIKKKNGENEEERREEWFYFSRVIPNIPNGFMVEQPKATTTLFFFKKKCSFLITVTIWTQKWLLENLIIGLLSLGWIIFFRCKLHISTFQDKYNSKQVNSSENIHALF